jgi:nucleotide-binding universal stress UspA family protein
MGRPGDEITLAAEQIGADLIVMGSRGLNEFRGALLGSTAAETVRSAGVPVLTIGAGSGKAFDPHRVLVADDIGPGGIAAIEATEGMFDPESARVLVLHVIDPGPLVYTGVSEWGWAPPPSIPLGNDTRVIAELEKRATRLRKKGFQVECLVANGSPAIVIARIAQKWRAKAVVLATHRRTALARLVIGSTAEAVVRSAPCPVLTVKPTVHTVQDTPAKPHVSAKGARPGVAPGTKLHVSHAAR